MKNFILIFTSLFILTACGSKDEEKKEETSAPSDTQQKEDVDIIEEDDETTPAPSTTVETEKASIEGKIVVDQPLPNAKITSPLTVRGEAVGPWFFEASFPITLLDDQGNELAKGAVTTSEEWMTEEMVSFEGKLTFDSGDATSGTLVLENDNPSGEADKAEKLEIPVRF